MKHIILSLAFACSAIGAGAVAPLDAVVAAALGADRTVATADAAAAAEQAELSAANILAGPEADFEYLWGPDGNRRWSAGVSQEIQWPGAYGARRNHLSAVDSLSVLTRRALLLDRALTYKLAVIDIVNARARLAFYSDVAESVERIAALTRNAYDHGEATILDLHKTRVAVLDSRREVAAAKADLETVLASLRASGADIPAADSDVWDAYPAQTLTAPPVDAAAYPQSALASARQRAGAAAASVVRTESLPGFKLGYVHSFEEQQHFNGLSFAVTLPSWGRKRQLAATEARTLETTLQYDAALAEAMAEANGQYQAALSLQSTLDDYRQLTGDNTYLDLLSKAFDGGELTVIDYVTEINTFKASRLGYLDLQYRYELALTRLGRYRSPLF